MSDIKVGIVLSMKDDGGVKRAAVSVDQLGASGERAAQRLNTGFSAARRGVESISSQLEKTQALMGKLAGLYVFKQFADSTITAAREIDRLNGKLEAASGSARVAGANFDFIKATARQMGVNLSAATEGFTQLSAAAQGTALQGQATRDIFTAIVRASAALGKSSADTQGMITALGQMMSKGTVSAEELRGQLGERLPGAFNLAARAMGVTTAQLDDMLQKGQITADEFLPKLARVIDETYSGARFNRINNEIERLDQTWEDFKRTVIDTDGMASAIRGLEFVLKAFADDLKASFSLGENGLQASLEKRITEQRRVIQEMKHAGPLGRLFIDDAEISQRETELRQMQEQLAKLKQTVTAAQQSAQQAATAGAPGGRAATPLGIAQQFQGMTERGNAEALTRFLNEHSGTVFNNLTVPWCARFVNASLDKAGIRGTGSAAARSFESYGKGVWQKGMSKDALADVQPGDIAVFTRKEGGHVGFVKAIDPTKGLLEILGGNQSNAVSVAKRSMSDLLAVRRPPTPGAKGDHETFDQYTKRAAQEEKQRLKERADLLREQTERWITQQDAAAKAADRAARVTVSQLDTQIAAIDKERDAYDQAQKAKIDAASGIFDAQMKLEADRANQLQAYAEQERALIQQQYAAKAQAMQAEAAAYQRQISNPALSFEQQTRAKEGLAQVTAELAQLEQERQQAELKASAAVNQASEGAQAMRQKEAAFIANINAELAYQTQLYAALKAAKDQGATPDQLGGMASVSDQMREAGQSVSREQLLALRPLLEELDQLKQKKQEMLGVDQQVREEQLRLNQAWQEAVQQAEEFATQASNAFGSLGTAIGKVVVGMAQYGQRAMQIQRDAKHAMDDLKKSGKSTPEKEFRVMEAAADKSLSNQMGLWGDLTAAAAGFFKEGSDGYKAMTVASQMFYAIKMGLAVKDAVLQISSAIEAMMIDQTRTTVEVANAGTRAAAKGAEAIMNQGQGDPYSAIPRMIAMAAMVTTILAGFGIAISGAVSGGSGASVPVPDTGEMQKKTGTGSVFGDAEAQSASLRNSLSILEDNSSADLDYTREMRDLLSHIDEGINGLASKIYATVRPPQLTEAMIKKGIDVVDYGIQGIQQTVGSILKGGLQGQSYQTYKREVEKSSFNFMMPGMDMGGGEKVVKWVRTIFNDIDAGVAKQFGMVLGDVVKSLEMAAKGLGIAGPDMVDKINRFVVDIGQISLKDMNAQEMSDAIHSVISKISDDLARLTMPQLKGFRRAGEGFAETTLRVYEASIRASGALKGLGIKTLELSEIQAKTEADLAAVIMRESIARAENGSSIGEYIRTLNGSTDDVIEQYKALRQARNLFAASGNPEANLGGDMIVGAGGLSRLQDGLQAYSENFLTETERLTAGWMDMADSFSAFGLKMPTTNAEFRKLVNGIDTSTQAGRELKGAVLALAPAFSELQSVMDDAMSTLKAAYDTAKQQSKDLRDYLNSLKTGQDTGGSVQQRYLSAKAIYEETLKKAQAGDPAAIAALQNVSSAFLDLSKQYFGATAQYAADLNNVQVSVGALADVIDAQITQAEAQVPALKANTDALTGLKDALVAYEKTMAKVNGIQSSQKGQGIDDINAGNKSGEEAANRRAAREKEASDYERRLAEMVRDLRYARNNGQDKKADKIKDEIDAYIAAINTDPDGYSVVWDGQRHDVQLLAKGGPAQPGWAIVGERGPELVQFQQSAFVHTAAATARLLREQATPDWESLAQGPIGLPVQARATGGYTPPGLTLVGERGPELVDFTRPTQVYTADQTKQALGMDTSKLEARLEALERAIAAGLKVDQAGYQALRSELQAIRAELAEQTTTQKLAALA